jgi:TatD DNase family protein
LIDSHCHIYLKDFKNDISEVLKRGIASGVDSFCLPAIDSTHMSDLLELEQQNPGICHAMTGLHPCSVKENYRTELDFVEQMLSKRKFIAIGEIGLDFYWDQTFVKEQYQALSHQLELAIQYKLPVVLHTRNAIPETIDCIKPLVSRGLRGVFHCFGGSLLEAEQIIQLGFYMGIGGVVTYKKSGLDEVLKHIPAEFIVLETDAPYLSPVPHRGKRNESSYMKLVADKVAEIWAVSFEEVDRVTTENARRLFGL